MTIENAARIPIVLTEADGTKHEMMFSPLTDRDMSELDEWLGARIVRIAATGCKGLSEDLQRMTMQAATTRAASISFMSGEGADLMSTVDGISRIFWQGVHREYPKVEMDWLRSVMFDSSNKYSGMNVKEVNYAMDKMSEAQESKNGDERSDPTVSTTAKDQLAKTRAKKKVKRQERKKNR